LETTKFSCFCDKCVDDIVEGECHSKLHVSPWTLFTLRPCISFDAHCDIETNGASWGNDGENNDPTMDLKVGDNFAVKAKASNVEGVEFYVVQCVEQMHIVQEDKGLDVYGFNVDKGDEVVIGLYYRWCGCKESTYELLNE
jgi:hypothetical protein